MFSLELDAAPGEADLLIAELWDAGCEGVVEGTAGERVTLRAFFRSGREALLERFAAGRPRVVEHEERDWVVASRSLLEPRTVGDRFYLAPEWREDPTPPGRLRINVNPGMAFGTGAHEATRLCLRALERRVRPGMTVLDVGTGSGILSIAAALLGAERVIGCDEDAEAVAIAAENATRAGARAVRLFAGSVGAIGKLRAGLVVANISAAASISLAGEMLRLGEAAVAGGFEADEEAAVRAAIEAAGGRVEESLAENSWRALVYVPASGGAA